MSDEFRLPWEPPASSELPEDRIDVAIVSPDEMTFHWPRGARTACGLVLRPWSMEKLSVALRIGRPHCLRCWADVDPLSLTYY